MESQPVHDHTPTGGQGPGSSAWGTGTGLFHNSLRTSIMYWFLVISLVPVVLVSWVGHHKAVQNRLSDYSQRLQSFSLDEQHNLSRYFEELTAGLGLLGHDEHLVAALAKSQAETAFPDRSLQAFYQLSGAENLLLLNGAGEVVFSCGGNIHPGVNVLLGQYPDPGLETIAREVFRTSQLGLSAFDHQGRAFAVAPVLAADNLVRGLLVLVLGNQCFQTGAQELALIHPAGRFLVVNEDQELVFLAGPDSRPGLSHPSFDWQKSLLMAMGQTRPVVGCYAETGQPEVLGSVQDLQLGGAHYALIAEIPRKEILAGLRHMDYSLLLMILAVGLLVGILGQILARRIVEPINLLAQSMQRVADGHEAWACAVGGPREVSRLTQVFHLMIQKLAQARQENEKQYALKRVQVELGEKLRQANSMETIPGAVLDFFKSYFQAQMGIFYYSESRGTLHPVAHFGLPDPELEIADVSVGVGAVGQAAQSGEVQILRKLGGDERHRVVSGLVESRLNNLILAPLTLDGRLLGVLELGLLAEVPDQGRELLELVSEGIAVAITTARSRARVHRLFKETWSQAAALARQQKELRDSNRRLERADQFKSEFLANMSHELRTPLNSMLIMSQVLAENSDGNLTRRQIESALTIHRAGSDLLLLINDILDLSRVEAGELKLMRQPWPLADLIQDVEDLFQPVADRQGVEFRVVRGPDLPVQLVTDPLRLMQILKNILNNAFKFTERGQVVLEIRRPETGELANTALSQAEGLVFHIQDTGIGMSEEVSRNIFKAFNQGDGSIMRRYGGSGLGLSISRNLCRLLGGEITFTSEEAVGSSFLLLIPVGENQVPADSLVQPGAQLALPSRGSGADDPVRSPDLEEPESTGLENHFHGQRILVCQDDMRTVFQISEILDELGAEVVLAPSWNQGVAECRTEQQFDLAIVSPRLADRPAGADIAAWKTATRTKDLPVLALVSGSAPAECEGADLVGQWPLDRREFVALLHQFLGSLEENWLPMNQ